MSQQKDLSFVHVADDFPIIKISLASLYQLVLFAHYKSRVMDIYLLSQNGDSLAIN